MHEFNTLNSLSPLVSINQFFAFDHKMDTAYVIQIHI